MAAWAAFLHSKRAWVPLAVFEADIAAAVLDARQLEEQGVGRSVGKTALTRARQAAQAAVRQAADAATASLQSGDSHWALQVNERQISPCCACSMVRYMSLRCSSVDAGSVVLLITGRIVVSLSEVPVTGHVPLANKVPAQC